MYSLKRQLTEHNIDFEQISPEELVIYRGKYSYYITAGIGDNARRIYTLIHNMTHIFFTALLAHDDKSITLYNNDILIGHIYDKK